MGETVFCKLCKKKFETQHENRDSCFYRKICEKCSMKEYGPSYADIRNCHHQAISLEETKRLLKKNPLHICGCEEGERGWTDPSGKRTLAPEKHTKPRISKKGNMYFEHNFMKQDNFVHTKRWDDIEQLKKKHGSKARSSLRISKNVIKILKSKPGPHRKGGRKKNIEFDSRDFISPPLDNKEKPQWTGKLLKGNPPYGNAHSIRRQIFLLFHDDPSNLRKLLFKYLDDKYEKDIFDEMWGEEKHLVTVWLPILERATDELIDEIVKCDRNSEITKEDLLKHPLLKDRTKWRSNLCRLVELKRIELQREGVSNLAKVGRKQSKN